MLGILFYLAKTREQAVRELTPLYEEHVKMFAPLGLRAGPDAGAGRGGGAARRLGRGRRADGRAFHEARLLVRRHAGRSRRLPQGLEERYPGMEHINFSSPLTTPKDVMLEQFQIVAEEVMPHFRSGARATPRPRNRVSSASRPPCGERGSKAIPIRALTAPGSPCPAGQGEAAGQGSVGMSALLQGEDARQPVAGPQPKASGSRYCEAGDARQSGGTRFPQAGQAEGVDPGTGLGPATHNPGLGCFRRGWLYLQQICSQQSLIYTAII